MNRRTFLVGLSSAAATTALAGCATSRSTARGGIIDTHTHFYDPSRAEGVPWPPKQDALLYRTVLPDELKRLAKPLGVTGTIVVEASPWVEDNLWVLDLAAREPFIVGLVGHLKPGKPDFAEGLARFAEYPLFLGIRTGLWGISIAPGEDQFIRDLRHLAERHLSLDVLGGPERLNIIAELASAIPELRIVVDHCAGVRVDGRAPADAWASGIRQMAQHPNVHMKVSGLVEGTGRAGGAPADGEFYHPVLDLIWDAFGEDRVLFGSNWPVSARFAEYAAVLRIVSDYFESKGRSAYEKYFWRNAARVYRYGAAAA